MRGRALAATVLGLLALGVIVLALRAIRRPPAEPPAAADVATERTPRPRYRPAPPTTTTAVVEAPPDAPEPAEQPPLVATIWEHPAPDGAGEIPPEAADEPTQPAAAIRELLPVDAEGIDAAVLPSLRDIRNCYQSWLALQPDLEGEIVVRFVVAERDGIGVVDRIEVVEGTTTGNTLFEGCVMNVMSDLRFEPPEGGGTVEVDYPFLFRSG